MAIKQVLESDDDAKTLVEENTHRDRCAAWLSPALIEGPKSCDQRSGLRNVCKVGGFPSICLWHVRLY